MAGMQGAVVLAGDTLLLAHAKHSTQTTRYAKVLLKLAATVV